MNSAHVALDRELVRLARTRERLVAREGRLLLETRALQKEISVLDERQAKVATLREAVEAALGAPKVARNGVPTQAARVLAVLAEGEASHLLLAAALGVDGSVLSPTLTRLVRGGQVERVSRGRYRLAEAPPARVARL